MNNVRIAGFLFWSVVVLQVAVQTPFTASGQPVVRKFFIRNGGGIALPILANADDADDIKSQIEAHIKSRKDSMEQRMAVRVDDLNHVCTLTPEQLQKLKIAAKGAIEKSMADFRKEMESVAPREANAEELELLEDADESEVEVPEEGSVTENAEASDAPPVEAGAIEDEAKAIEPKAFVDVPINVQPIQLALAQPVFDATISDQNPELQSIWKSTVEKTLTSDQATKFDQVLTERTKQQTNAAVENFITRVDMELFLQPAQREKLSAWVHQGYGERLRSMIANPNTNVFVDVGQFGDEQARSEVSAILTPAQLGIWNSKFHNELEMLENMNGFGGVGRPGIRWFRD